MQDIANGTTPLRNVVDGAMNSPFSDYDTSQVQSEARKISGSSSMQLSYLSVNFHALALILVYEHLLIYGIGASKVILAHAALQLPKAELQATMAAGAAAARTVPNVNPAAE